MKKRLWLFITILVLLGVFFLFIHNSKKTSLTFIFKDIVDSIFWQDISKTDFNLLHSPLEEDSNAHLILGAKEPVPPASELSEQLSVFLGRWEGYDFAPPVEKDVKIVLVITQIDSHSGKAFLWVGSNLQYPFWVKEINFRVVSGASPVITWEANISNLTGFEGMAGTFELGYDNQSKTLKGGIRLHSTDSISGWVDQRLYLLKYGGLQLSTPKTVVETIELSHSSAFYVYEDYPAYLATKGISLKNYRDQGLQAFGQGYLLYLPQDYETETQQAWPLILFLCGSGDRGDNGYLLAKASPLMMIREKGSLPMIIAAPMLNSSSDYASFPDSYLEGVLAEIEKEYRIDSKRIYLTGLSMGGEAVYRFALNHPDRFAALAPLAGFNPKYLPMLRLQGYESFKFPMERIKHVPVWQISGENDIVVPPSAAQKTADDLIKAGGNVKFSILPGHDHDVWTDTYSDPAFYDWLLQQKTP